LGLRRIQGALSHLGHEIARSTEATSSVAESECARREIRSDHQETYLERMILFGEQSLRTAIHNFVIHYHTECNHQGLANRLISPEPGHLASAGVVQRRQRLGGMLNYCYRAA
jgi:hypothetical protein